MAVYVLMNKIEDNKEKVIYEFEPNEKTMEIIEFNKIKNVSDDDSVNKAYEKWAAEKIAK